MADWVKTIEYQVPVRKYNPVVPPTTYSPLYNTYVRESRPVRDTSNTKFIIVVILAIAFGVWVHKKETEPKQEVVTKMVIKTGSSVKFIQTK